ncbi:hypothetical protein WL77_01830 [Burkholderia ubonensis]|uniref:hypothetical protein n=1 Tax=Burkholderia ubonensis TaxID=101571 RepID=UPI0007541083|nr:hypothetical protein [Burkholderia ubonensis]KWE67970.1 hypothetical protein WL77_01830 [Burkholderia ubonensis]KWE69969.1 hypothetical protein WL79_21090 [Burkholderia ubonensis]
MKRLLLAAVTIAATLSVTHAQTQTYPFGEGGTQPQGAAQPAQPAPLPGAVQTPPLPQGAVPTSRPAPRRPHARPHRHHRHHHHAAVKRHRHHVRHARPTRHVIYRYS